MEIIREEEYADSFLGRDVASLLHTALAGAGRRSARLASIPYARGAYRTPLRAAKSTTPYKARRR